MSRKTDIGLSWKIFVECLTRVAIYIILEAIDRMHFTPKSRDQFQQVLQRFSELAIPGAIKNKIIKVMITSTKPDAGFNHIFGEPDSKSLRDANSSHVLARISPAAARSRKQRYIPGVKRRVRIPSKSHAMVGLTFQCEKILTDDDFVPEPEHMEVDDSIQRMDSDEDFDIYEETSSPFNIAVGKTSYSVGQVEVSGRTSANFSINCSAISSESLLDMFRDGYLPRQQETGLSWDPGHTVDNIGTFAVNAPY